MLHLPGRLRGGINGEILAAGRVAPTMTMVMLMSEVWYDMAMTIACSNDDGPRMVVAREGDWQMNVKDG